MANLTPATSITASSLKKNKSMPKFFKHFLILATLFAANVANAQTFTGVFTNPLTGNPGDPNDPGLSEIIDGVMGFLLGVAMLVCPVLILYGAFLIATSGGAEEKTKQGKHYITYAVVGLVIIALSSVIKAIIYDIVIQ